MKRGIKKWLDDDLLRTRFEYYLWWVLVPPTIIWWRSSVTWVVFMSLYAIIKTLGDKIEILKAKREQERRNQKPS
jgi:hypothetical protein